MTDLSIDQILLDGESVRARSSKVSDLWERLAIDLVGKFGRLPPETKFADVLLARPFGPGLVAIGRVNGPKTHLLILGRDLYGLLHDPFAIADRYPPNWDARETLQDLEWPPEPLPHRTVGILDDILKTGDGPLLLGGAQALVDSSRILLQRSEPQLKLFRDMWALLPASARRAVWPATFATRNDFAFDLVAMPEIPADASTGYLAEEHVRDYPDSRYERNLQIAIEEGDQPGLDRLLARKNTSEMINLALLIIGLGFGVMVAVRILAALGVF